MIHEPPVAPQILCVNLLPPESLVGMTNPFSWQHCIIVASSENLQMMHGASSKGGGSGEFSTAIKPEEKFGYS